MGQIGPSGFLAQFLIGSYSFGPVGPDPGTSLRTPGRNFRISNVKSLAQVPLYISGPTQIMEEMKEFLRLSDLSQYVNVFNDMGYDSLTHLFRMGHKELVDLRQITSMKPGHFARFVRSIRENVTATRNEASHPRGSMSQIPVSDAPSDVAQLGPIPVGPIPVGPTAVIMAARDGVAQNGPNEIGPQEFDDGPLLQVYDHWKKARVASLNHSTIQGCSIMANDKKSGGKYKVLGCRSVLSKKKAREEDDGPPCPYVLFWSQDKKGDWKLNQAKSILRHKPFCCSGQAVTQMELLQDDKFIRTQRLAKSSTGKAAAKSALSSHGRLAGSVKDYTARRARNTIKHSNDVDYDDDWSKLNEWGQKFMQLNPQCIFDLEKDEENR